ncbi:TetR/AcrR family transcriptional regulator [Paenibacillus sp. BAC0078]
MSKETDLRVLKTRKLIRGALISLIAEKGFEAVTVNDIAGQAQINRSTFYLHYTDKYELLNTTVDEVTGKLISLIIPGAHVQEGHLNQEGLTRDIEKILATIAEDALFYKAMLGGRGIQDFRLKLGRLLAQKLDQGFQEQPLISKDIFIELLSSLYLGAISWWLNNDMKYSPAFMAGQLVVLLTSGPVNVSGLVPAEC